MKIILSDFKKGIVKFKITDPEDFWHLNQLIEEGDQMTGKTLRKITLGTADTKTAHILKPAILTLMIERVEHAESGAALRVSGKIISGPDDMPRGSYHTFSLEQDTDWTLEKEDWLAYHKSQLTEASKTHAATILLCVFDRDESIIALVRNARYDILVHLQSDGEKKEKRAITKGNFYKTIAANLSTYNERYKPGSIIVASPAFYKEYLMEELSDESTKKKIILATCSSAHENAIGEVLKRAETRSALKQLRVTRETESIEKLLTEIGKEGNATYGLGEVNRAADAGAISDIFITDVFIKESKAKETFKELNTLLKKVDKVSGSINIISTEHDAGKKLQGLGGIAALLRYKLEWKS